MADLADIVIVNESRDEATAGDVTVFRSAEAACAWLEHWWVENGEGFAFTASGERLTLGVETDRVIVVSRQSASGGRTLVHRWLRVAATAVLEARRVKDARGKLVLSQAEQDGRLPASVEELVAYVGFTR